MSNGKQWLGMVGFGAAAMSICSVPAGAVTINVLESNGNFISNFSQLSELDFDVFWVNILPVWVQVQLGPDETGPIAFSGFHNAFDGLPWSDFHIELEGGAVWQEANRIRANGDPLSSSDDLQVTNDKVWVFFEPPDVTRLAFGDPDEQIDPGVDWFIDVSNVPFVVGADVRFFDIHIVPTRDNVLVPEPITMVLGLMGLSGCGVSLLGRRRRG